MPESETIPLETVNSENNSDEPQRATEIAVRDEQDVNNLNLRDRTMQRPSVRIVVNRMQLLFGHLSSSMWTDYERHGAEEGTSLVEEPQQEDNFVIDIEASPDSDVTVNLPQNSPADRSPDQEPGPSNDQQSEAQDAQNRYNNMEQAYGALDNRTKKMFKIIARYITLFLILFAKCINDYRTKIIHFVILLVTTLQADSDLKREISNQQNKSYKMLMGIFLYVSGCIAFVVFFFEQPILPRITWITSPTSAWELLWIVAITDFMMKILTILCKLVLTCFSAEIVSLQRRGKYYLMLEAISQLFRSLIPIPLWFNFLFEAYQGVEKIFGFFLLAIYTIGKGVDIFPRAKLVKYAVKRIIQQISVGSVPTDKQLETAGGICPICYDKYSQPVRLKCQHIFCELCVIIWLDRERSCPVCRTPVSDNPIYRDGKTSHFIQLF